MTRARGWVGIGLLAFGIATGKWAYFVIWLVVETAREYHAREADEKKAGEES